MKASLIATVVASLLGLGSLAHAARIASPAAYAGFAQRRAECWIRNGGTTSMSVEANLIDESGNVVPAGSSCGAPVTAGSACVVFANVANGVAYACSATASASARNLRGTIVLKDVNGVVLRAAALR